MHLEPELWAALFEICKRECKSVHELVQLAIARRPELGPMEAVRARVLEFLCAEAADCPGRRFLN